MKTEGYPGLYVVIYYLCYQYCQSVLAFCLRGIPVYHDVVCQCVRSNVKKEMK